MGSRTVVAHLCNEPGISSQTLYRYVSPIAELRSSGKKLIREKYCQWSNERGRSATTYARANAFGPLRGS
jgi:hypothetical protein